MTQPDISPVFRSLGSGPRPQPLPSRRKAGSHWLDAGLPDSVAAGIGHVSTAWSILEDIHKGVIGQLLGIDGEVTHAVAAELNPLQIAGIIRAVLNCTRRPD
jgi:hypothetical protein